jgi:hypothetical protein
LKASFKISDSFYLSGRGLVAMGDILSGVIKAGDLLDVDIENIKARLRITSVEIADHIGTGQYFVGLILKSDSNFDLTAVKLKPQIVEIFAG